MLGPMQAERVSPWVSTARTSAIRWARRRLPSLSLVELEVTENRATRHVEQNVLSRDGARVGLEEEEKDIFAGEVLISRPRSESTGVVRV